MKLPSALALLVIAFSAFAQSANQYLRLQGFPQHGYIEIPADSSLSAAKTIEAWVSVRDAHGDQGCSSIAGNGFTTGWWLGVCGTSMRSYFNGVSGQKTGGTIPNTPNTWVHIAAVTDGVKRRHYINGELVFESGETAPASSSARGARIGSDPDWQYTATGGIDDLRIWSVARTQAQIRRTMLARYAPVWEDVTGEFQGLEAWYRFEGSATDWWHTHHGTIMGTGIGFELGSVFTAQPTRRRGMRH